MISKRYRANMESGIIHDMNNPCWSALHSNPKKMRDFFHLEEAKAEDFACEISPTNHNLLFYFKIP